MTGVHLCHAWECERQVPPRMLMCAKHWRMVPKSLQDAVWDTYVNGQEDRKDPSYEYLIASQNAINAVADRESRLF